MNAVQGIKFKELELSLNLRKKSLAVMAEVTKNTI